MTPEVAKALGCAYFSNKYGVLRLCHSHNPRLWPSSRIYRADITTCPGCVEMLARRVEVRLEPRYFMGVDMASGPDRTVSYHLVVDRDGKVIGSRSQ